MDLRKYDGIEGYGTELVIFIPHIDIEGAWGGVVVKVMRY
jgi:hypothetical protein